MTCTAAASSSAGTGAQLSVKTFDSEFAWYGPIGFDLGLLWANLLIAAARAQVLGEPERAADLLDGIARSWRVFVDRMTRLWPTRVDAPKYPDLALSPWLELDPQRRARVRRLRGDAADHRAGEGDRHRDPRPAQRT